MAQRLNEGHRLVVGPGLHLLQTRPPDGHLLQQPLAGGGLAPLTADDHLLGEARHVRPEHGVQPQHRPLVYRQHMGKRFTLDAGHVHQQAVLRQVAEPVDHLAGDVDGHRHHHQPGAVQDLVGAWPIGLTQGFDPVAREAEQVAEQAAKLPLATDDHHLAELRLHALEVVLLVAGGLQNIGLAHHPAQHILDKVPRHPQCLGLGAAAGQHARLPIRCIDGQAVPAFHFPHFPHQGETGGQQINQLLVHRIYLVPEGIQLFRHVQSLLAPPAATPCHSRGNKVSLRGQ